MKLIGNRTNILAVMAIVYGITAMITGNATPKEGMEIIWGGFIALSGRAAIKNLKV